MKMRWNATIISATVLSLCLISFVPVALKSAGTWRQLYFEQGGGREQNYLMPMGFSALGFVAIGLITLWTGYQKHERRSWFVVLIIILCFVFPGLVLPRLLESVETGGIEWSIWFRVLKNGEALFVGYALDVLIFFVMMVALALPIKFFWGSPATRRLRTKNREAE